MSSLANAQAGQVASLAAANTPGITELEFTISRSGAGVTSIVTSRPDLVASVSNGVAGTYVVTLSSAAPAVTLAAPMFCSGALTRTAASTARGVQMRDDSTSTVLNFLVTDGAGALVNLANSDFIHITLRFRRDGRAF